MSCLGFSRVRGRESDNYTMEALFFNVCFHSLAYVHCDRTERRLRHMQGS